MYLWNYLSDFKIAINIGNMDSIFGQIYNEQKRRIHVENL